MPFEGFLRVLLATFSFTLFSYSLTVDDAFARRGGEVGNGGDVVLCRNSGTSTLFTLDSLLAPPKSSFLGSDILNEVVKSLYIRQPELASSLNSFVDEIKSEDLTKTHVWSPVRFGLIDIEDEMLVEKLPPNCGGDSTLLPKQWQQAVVQTKVGSKLYYKYDSMLIDEIEKTPLQFSMLMVHEWLWTYADNALQVRLANQFLHEQGTARLSSYKLQKELLAFGLHIPDIDPLKGTVVNTEVNQRGQLRDSRILTRASPQEPFFIKIENLSSIEYEVRLDDGDGSIDPRPEMLPAGKTITRLVPVPSVIFLYDRSAGWPAVQYLEIRQAP